MTDYEIIGRSTVWLGAISLLLGIVVLILKGAWFAVQEIYGWPRIAKALKILREEDKAKESNE